LSSDTGLPKKAHPADKTPVNSLETFLGRSSELTMMLIIGLYLSHILFLASYYYADIFYNATTMYCFSLPTTGITFLGRLSVGCPYICALLTCILPDVISLDMWMYLNE